MAAVIPLPLPNTLPPRISSRAAYTEPPQGAPDLGSLLSPSQVGTFADCQAKWWYKYALGLPDPPNANLSLGQAVHAALAHNFRQKEFTRVDLATSDVAEFFYLAWSAAESITEFRDDDDPDALADTGLGLIEKYMADHAPTVQPAAVETEITGTIGGVNVRGRIDIRTTDGTIIDFKTAAKKPNGTNNHVLQLATYAALDPQSNGKVRVDVLVKTKVPAIYTVPRDLSAADRQLPARLYPLAQLGMRTGVHPPNRGSMLCSRKNCPFWARCEEDFGGAVDPV